MDHELLEEMEIMQDLIFYVKQVPMVKVLVAVHVREYEFFKSFNQHIKRHFIIDYESHN